MSELYLSAIFRKLRPPYILPVKVAYGFSATEPTNFGLTLEIPDGSPLVACGDGTVDLISQLGGKWRNESGGVVRSIAIRIDHGRGVKTWVHGLATVTCGYGPITRGAQIGTALGPHVFLSLEHNGKLQDPTSINSTFTIQDGFLNYGKGQKIRQAPDVITTVFSNIASLIGSGIRYFFPPTPQQVLFNLDFNGQGTKSGAAVVGAYGDVWNQIAPLDFAPVSSNGYYGYTCYGGTVYPADPGFFLVDYRGTRTKVYFERLLLTANAGISSFFDPMLSSWVGGYNGVTPRVNSFGLRNLPGGEYSVYVYSNGGVTSDTTTVYVSADNDTPTSQVLTPTVSPSFIEGANYVVFDLTVANRGKITITTYGYIAGVQIIRTAV